MLELRFLLKLPKLSLQYLPEDLICTEEENTEIRYVRKAVERRNQILKLKEKQLELLLKCESFTLEVLFLCVLFCRSDWELINLTKM